MTTIHVGGPWFEEFEVGQIMPSPPSVTLTEGHAALHQAMFHDRLRLPLDRELSQRITGASSALVNPSLLCNAAIGQTTFASARVKANLFYRGLVLKRPVFIGDTLSTTTKIVALKQNKSKPGRAATGVVALEMTVTNQHAEEVIKFWRCPMIPCKDPEAVTGHADSFDTLPQELNIADLEQAIPASWQLDRYREELDGEHFNDIAIGNHYVIESRDTITSAPELVRLTLNMAVTHTDAGRSAYNKRLVYGGHTISMGAAQLTRALPNLLSIIGWRRCDHTAPVFENDILHSEITVTNKQQLKSGGLLDLHIKVFAERGDQAPEAGENILVLDWECIAVMA